MGKKLEVLKHATDIYNRGVLLQTVLKTSYNPDLP